MDIYKGKKYNFPFEVIRKGKRLILKISSGFHDNVSKGKSFSKILFYEIIIDNRTKIV